MSGPSDPNTFWVVVLVVGAMLVLLALAVWREWLGFYRRSDGNVTISEYVYNGLGRSRSTVAIAAFIMGAAFAHFIA